MQRSRYKAQNSFFSLIFVAQVFRKHKRMHSDLQFKTRLDHVSLKTESITLLCAQICVLQCVQNMQSLGSFSITDLDGTFWKPAVCKFQSPGDSCERRATVIYGITCWVLSQNKTSYSILPGSIITSMQAALA